MEVLLRGPLSRSEIARRLDLTPATLTRLTKPLLDEGLLIEADLSSTGRAGRPSRPLDIMPDAHHFIGVNLTGEMATGVVTTLRAEVRDSIQLDIDGREPDAVVATIRRVLHALVSEERELGGLGVSLGGHVRNHRIATRAPFLHWFREVQLAALTEEATGLPVIVDNDLLALTRAEHWFGIGRDVDRFAVLTIGAGVGYGLVMHNQIVDSPDAGIGLVGHIRLNPLGPPCVEGHRGCATSMLSIPSICYQISVGLARELSYDECLDLAADGEPAARSVIDEAGSALGQLLAVIANATMVDRILVTGEGSRLAEVAHEAVDAGLREGRDPRASSVRWEVEPVDFTSHARGAAVAAIQSYAFGG